MPLGMRLGTRVRRFEYAALAIACLSLVCFASLAAAVARGETAQFDRDLRAAVHAAASPGLTQALRAATFLGSQAAVLGVSFCAALIFWASGRRDRAWLMVLAMAGGELLLWSLKVQIHRARPEPFFGTPLPASYSFPSGHALLSVCCYATVSALTGNRLMTLAAAALIASIGISRIYLGVHYPTDVIGGYLIGAAWLAGVAGLYVRSLR